MTPFELAQRYVGIREIAGAGTHPLIAWWLSLCFDGRMDLADETPWCSAFLNGVAWELRLPRSKSARARSWLLVGVPVSLGEARVGSDVVVLNRGGVADASVIESPGHVGLFAGLNQPNVLVLAGNQGDAVSVRAFAVNDVLGVRRLA